MVAHHADAACTWDDDRFRPAKLLHEAGRQGKGFTLITRVPVHLSAAGLPGREDDGVAEVFEHTDDCLAGRGEERVVITGDEEGNLQARPPPVACPAQLLLCKSMPCAWRGFAMEIIPAFVVWVDVRGRFAGEWVVRL